MALVVTAAVPSANEGTGTTIPNTTTVNIPATATCVWLAFTVDDQGTTSRTFTVTWDAGVTNQAMTQVPNARKSDALSGPSFAVYRRLAPVTGAAVPIEVTASPAFANRQWRIIPFYAEDGNTTTPEDSANLNESATATSTSNTTASATGEVVVSILMADNRTVGSTGATHGGGGGATPNLGEFNTGGGVYLGGDQVAGAASVGTAWGWGGSSIIAAEIAFNIKAAAAGGRTTKNIRAFPLGEALGMGLGMPGYCREREAYARRQSGIFVPSRYAA